MTRQNILDACDVTDESGKVRSVFPRKSASDWVPDGIHLVLRGDGSKLLEITYRQGVPHGAYLDFWSNGVVASEGQFHEGKQEGIWHFYAQDGRLMDALQFKGGNQIPPSENNGG